MVWIFLTHLFHVLQNVIVNKSKYSKFAENNPQHVTEFLNKAIKIRTMVEHLCHIRNKLIIETNVHQSFNIKELEKFNVTATTN